MKFNLTSISSAAASLALLFATPFGLQAATHTVTSIADNGPGTLRDALAAAANGDTIDATGVSGTITLSSGQLSVPTSLAILGPGASTLTVSGNGAFRVFDLTGTNVTIRGLRIVNGHGDFYGPGIRTGGPAGSVVTVSDCVLTNNSTTLDGGGLYNSPGVTLTISNCTVCGNYALGNGGGVYNNHATLTIIASTLSSNSAYQVGGGIMNDGQTSGSATLTIIASTISSNSAWTGGGILNYASYGSATLRINATTFNGNSAGFAGGSLQNSGWYGTAAVEIGDSILNAGASGGNIYNDAGTVTSRGYNLSSDTAGGLLTATGDQTDTDPKLGPLQDNGGPTWTHALLPGSPAIDKGKRDAVPALARDTDQRGLARPVDNPYVANATVGDGSDIGAFEVKYLIVTNTADSAPGSLRATLAAAADNDTLCFSVSGTITLTGGQLTVPRSLSILGPGAAALTVSANHASRVFNVTGPSVTISELTIANGQVDAGAGIYNHPGMTLTVSNCAILSNSASAGGGIYNYGNLNVVNSTISGNSGLNGGGICNNGQSGGSATLTITASTLSGNSATAYGGAIYSNGGDSGYAPVTIKASTISGNSASDAGAGISTWSFNGTGPLTINASTFSDNWSGAYGGAIDCRWTALEIGDTILKHAGSGMNIYRASGSSTSRGYNLSSDGTSWFTATGDQINTDPRLGPLQDNGGPTWTHALLAGSPAIDKGKANAVPALANSTDQRGRARPVDFASAANATSGDGSDIGAYEIQQVIPVTSIADSGPGTLREALASAVVSGTIVDATSVSGMITLTNGQLSVPNSVTILGPGPATLKVSANHASRVFNLTATNVTIRGLTIADGQDAGRGMGICAASPAGSVIAIRDCVVTNNSTTWEGGGIFNSYGVTMTVSNCAIAGNSAAGNGGGGIYNWGVLNVLDSTLAGNWAYYAGGGILNDPGVYGATLAVSASTFSGNSAHNGGAICNWGEVTNATLTLNASTFSGNSADYYGGGVFNYGDLRPASLTVNACTFSGNAAVYGGGIANVEWYGNATLEIGDTILNAGASGATIYTNAGATVTSYGYNLCSDNGGGVLKATGDQTSTDPKLGPLQNSGGCTCTHAPLPGSPALDRGKTNAVAALARNTDQRGLTRSVDNPYLANAAGGDTSDIGAFEAQGTGGYDTDADNLPDFWELAYFGNCSQSGASDSDGDGQNNLFECTAGLNPADPASVFSFRIEPVAGQPNRKNLIFQPWAAGRAYVPQFTTNLLGTAFVPLAGYGGPTTNGSAVTITDTNATAPEKLYRIQISLP